MLEFFQKLFSGDFMPHGASYLWNPAVIWLNVISDALIATCYYTIPVFLFVLARKRKDLTFHGVFVAFAAFILACGTTHVLGVWTVWYPMYRLDGVLKAVTAIASIITTALLFPLLPVLLRLPSPAQLTVANQNLAIEIEARKRMAAVLERQAGLLELAHDAIIVRDLTGRIQFWSRGAQKLYGWSKELAEGAMKHELLQTGFPEALQEIQDELIETGCWEGDLRHTKRDGSKVIVSSRWALRRTDDGRIEVLEINRDITRDAAEQEIRKLFARALQEKNVELEKANLAKNRFLATMSHELRTPLNAIIGFTGTLLMRLPGPLTPVQEKQLRMVQSSGRHLLSLINDLLDLAKIESEKLELRLEPVSCREVLDEIAAYLRPMAESRDVIVSVNTPPGEMLMKTDRRALHQILLNLSNNAVKFTEAGSVQLEVRERLMGDIPLFEFSVIDTGIGIRPEDKSKLFQAFSRVNVSSEVSHQGSGLGLYLSQKLAEMLSGQITFESEFGKGSTFRLTLSPG
ncbi:MAG: PAS domain-containing sensor histidine kinase [Bryobacteraceae bacterium]